MSSSRGKPERTLDSSVKPSVKVDARRSNPSWRSDMQGPIKLCPFNSFRICNETCKFYICHGRCKILAERIKKGYANEYLSSVLF